MLFTLLRTPNGIPFYWLEKFINKQEFLDKFIKNSKIKKSTYRKRIIISEDFIALSAIEKFIGDSWVNDFISLI